RRVTGLEEVLNRRSGICQLGVECGINAAPQIGEHQRREILGTEHGWRDGGEPAQLRIARRHDAPLDQGFPEIGKSAESSDISCSKLAPIRERWWKAGSDLVRT